MMTVPVTTGVNIRRSRERRAASMNWNRDDMTMSVAIIAGPPLARATTHTEMKAPDVPRTDSPDPDGLENGGDPADQ